MIGRTLMTMSLVAAAAGGCAPAKETPEAQQAVPQAQAQPTAQASNTCWTRGDPAALAGRASAFDSTTATVAGRTIKVCYSRPQMKGRTVMGGLVPYGRPWRLGANEATVLHMPVAGTIADVPVEAGSYSLYAVPGETEWSIYVNRTAQRWGIPLKEAVRANDVGSGTVKTETVSNPVDPFTIRFDRVTGNGATLVIEWERTRVRVPVTVSTP